jgi:hypothetical protein
MQTPTTTNSTTYSASSQPIVGEPSSQGHLAQTAASSTRSRGSWTQTKWPEDKLTATGLMLIFGVSPMLQGIDLYWSWFHCSGEGVNQQGG